MFIVANKMYTVPEPASHEIELTGEEQYMVLACDILWDVMNAQQFVNAYVNERHQQSAYRQSSLASWKCR